MFILCLRYYIDNKANHGIALTTEIFSIFITSSMHTNTWDTTMIIGNYREKKTSSITYNDEKQKSASPWSLVYLYWEIWWWRITHLFRKDHRVNIVILVRLWSYDIGSSSILVIWTRSTTQFSTPKTNLLPKTFVIRLIQGLKLFTIKIDLYEKYCIDKLTCDCFGISCAALRVNVEIDSMIY